MTAAIQGTNPACAEDRRPTNELHLPRLADPSLCRFYQVMLGTVAEGPADRLQPVRQPCVEAYKKHMNAILREK